MSQKTEQDMAALAVLMDTADRLESGEDIPVAKGRA